MSEGTEYLEFLIPKLNKSLEELRATLKAGKEDIHKMNDYFWENYTEMDEYGYEDYDNQQLLLRQNDINQEHKRTLAHLAKMLDSPFFGSVKFAYTDEDMDPEDEIDEDDLDQFYIGIANFSPQAGDIPLIYDWRAPVSGLFYDYDAGPAFYEAPMGTMEGTILSKKQYKIRNGQMVYEFENDTKIDDEILKEELGKNGDVKLKNIIRTIQKEQNQIIRNTKDKVMIIQGAAGSGKTSIALHRIAYLLYHDRQHLKSSQVLILSPNGVFSDYISHILPELGEERIQEMSFDIYAYHTLKDIARDCEERYDQMEHLMKLEKRPVGRRIIERFHYKQSQAFVKIMDDFIDRLGEKLLGLHEVSFRKKKKTKVSHDQTDLVYSVEYIHTLFFEKFTTTPLLSRMDAVAEKFIDDYETLFETMPPENADLLRASFRDMYITTDIYAIYNQLLEEQHMQPLPDLPPQARVLRYEDVYPMLYMKYRLTQVKQHRVVRHLIVDEMQDYSYLQFKLISMMFPCSKTILGDRAQTLEPGQEEVLSFLPDMFENARIIRLNKSYRNTLEIAEYAAGFQNIPEIEYFERHGKAVEIRRDRLEETAPKPVRLAQAVSDMIDNQLLKLDTFQTAAILTMNAADAQRVYELVKDSYPDASLLDKDSMHFNTGLTVTTWYLAKGLEFDQVFIMPANRKSSYYDQYQYICATRALHELYV